jgi:hypothetical protein
LPFKCNLHRYTVLGAKLVASRMSDLKPVVGRRTLWLLYFPHLLLV